MKHVLLFEQFVIEKIKASEAYNSWDGVQAILDGKRELAFLATMDMAPYGPNDKKELDVLKFAEDNGLKTIKVKNRKPGRAWIVYKSDKKMAQKLADFAATKEGFLNDNTPEEAKLVGDLLGYENADIKDYIKRKYK